MTSPESSIPATSPPARYRYRASTESGGIVEGVLEATSRQNALEELRRQRLAPIDLAPAAGKGALRRRRTARTTALARFARTAATMLAAGVTLERTLAFAAGQAAHPEVAAALRRVHLALQGGASLGEALAAEPAVCGPLFVALVSAGEESGALDEALARLADHLEETDELRARIRAALLYPLLMAIASGVGTVILLLFVVPRFVALVNETDAALPLSTRLLIGLSRIVVDGWPWLLLATVAAWLAVRAWLERPGNRRRWHGWRLGWPVSGEIELLYATGRFSRALGMLLRGGLPVLPSLRAAAAAVTNLEIGAGIERAAEGVSHGKPLHAALSGTLPPLATELIGVGEESGRLDDLCLRIADTCESDVRRTLHTLVTLIEPAMILLFGLLVGFVALAMLQAIYGLNASLL
jgi:type II secretory pathway component PulF